MEILDWHRFRGLYGMVDVAPAPDVVATARTLALDLVRGGARILQLRMKGADAESMLAVAESLAPIARDAGRPFIVNDRVDVALAAGADGVHLGQDDLPVAAARTVAAGRRLLVGVSTHNLDQVRAALAAGADYLGFGPVFATRSKLRPDPVVGLERLAEACRLASPVPVVAIGGIGLEETPGCARAGATAVAVIRFVNGAPNVEEAASSIAHAFAAGINL